MGHISNQWGVFRSEALNNRMIFTQLKFQCLLMESKKRQMLHNHAAGRGKSPHKRGLQGSGQNLTTVCPSRWPGILEILALVS